MRTAAPPTSTRLFDHQGRIAYKKRIPRSCGECELNSKEQGEPLGLVVIPAAQIGAEVVFPAVHHGRFHGAGIRPAASIEEDMLHGPPSVVRPENSPSGVLPKLARSRCRYGGACRLYRIYSRKCANGVRHATTNTPQSARAGQMDERSLPLRGRLSEMTENKLSALLRSATEDDVIKALEGAPAQPPLSAPSDLLEFYHRMLDVMTDAGKEADAADRLRIPPGFGSTD